MLLLIGFVGGRGIIMIEAAHSCRSKGAYLRMLFLRARFLNNMKARIVVSRITWVCLWLNSCYSCVLIYSLPFLPTKRVAVRSKLDTNVKNKGNFLLNILIPDFAKRFQFQDLQMIVVIFNAHGTILLIFHQDCTRYV